MDISEWTEALAAEMAASFRKLKPSEEIMILDIGIFPWNGGIELSAFFVRDLEKSNVFEDEIASWPGYFFSADSNKEWPETKELSEAMKADYAIDSKNAEKYFYAAAEAAKSEILQSAILQLTRSENFTVQVLHPDHPDKNYM